MSKKELIRVLLVEDNPGDARLLQLTLEEAGTNQFVLTHAKRLDQALRYLKEENVEIVLLDLSLPDSQGMATFTSTRAAAPDVPIIMMTGLDDEALALESMHHGAQDYLVKGQVDERLLTRSIKYAIERNSAESALRESEENARRLAEESAALAEISRIISSSLDIDDVYERFAEEVRKLIPFDRIVINLIDLENGMFHNAYITGRHVEARLRGEIKPLANTTVGVAVRTQQTFFCKMQSLEELPPSMPGIADFFKAGLRVLICVPMFSNDRIIGVLTLTSTDANAYTDSRVALAENVATQIAGAVANSQLHANILEAEKALRKSDETARRLADENALLAEIGRIISSSLDIDDVYERFAEEVRKLVPFDRLAINLVNLEEGTYLNAYATGAYVSSRQPGIITPLANTMTGQIVSTQEKFFYQARSLEDLPPNMPGMVDLFNAGLRTFITVPLISKDRIIGTLAFTSTDVNAYNESHVALAENVATQIAGAIANSQLHANILKAEEALSQSERRYRHMVEEASDVVCTLDSEGYFTYVNPLGRGLTGYTHDELIGQHFTYLLNSDWRKRVEIFYAKQLLRRIPETLLELTITTKSGERIWLEQTATLLIVGDEVAGFQLIGRDVTKRKHIEEEREKLITELQEAAAKINTLSGLLPICASCKKIRDDTGYWSQIEEYIQVHSEAEFSHGICPDCVLRLYPEVYLKSRHLAN